MEYRDIADDTGEIVYYLHLLDCGMAFQGFLPLRDIPQSWPDKSACDAVLLDDIPIRIKRNLTIGVIIKELPYEYTLGPFVLHSLRRSHCIYDRTLNSLLADFNRCIVETIGIADRSACTSADKCIDTRGNRVHDCAFCIDLVGDLPYYDIYACKI